MTEIRHIISSDNFDDGALNFTNAILLRRLLLTKYGNAIRVTSVRKECVMLWRIEKLWLGMWHPYDYQGTRAEGRTFLASCRKMYPNVQFRLVREKRR